MEEGPRRRSEKSKETRRWFTPHGIAEVYVIGKFACSLISVVIVIVITMILLHQRARLLFGVPLLYLSRL